MTTQKSLGSIVALLLAVVFSPAQGRATSRQLMPHQADRAAAASDRLFTNLFSYSIQPIPTPRGDAPEEFEVRFTIDAQPVTARLSRRSRRAADFIVLEDSGGGALAPFDSGPVRTYQGTLLEDPAARMTAYLAADGGLTARITLGDAIWYVEPATGDGLAHVIYRRDAVVGLGGACGVVAETASAVSPPAGGGGAPGPRGAQPPFFRAQIAFDADHEYYEEYGSTSDVVAQIEANMNDCADIYEHDVNLCWEITAIIVRTNVNDPYSDEEEAGALLDEFAAEWNAHQAGTPRTTAHLMTGKDLAGSTIGIARVGGIRCTSGQPDVTQAFGLQEDIVIQSRRTELCAHEIGHNWNACHCDDAASCVEIEDCGIMTSSVGLTEGRTYFSQFSQSQIEDHIALVSACQLIACGCRNTILVPEYPFSTIENAVASAPCGSVVSVRAGTYTVGGPLNSGPGRTVRVVARGGVVYIDHE